MRFKMASFKKKTVEKINKQHEQSKYKSYCLICQKVHKLNAICNKEITLFVKQHVINMYKIANKEEKLQLLKIVQDSRTELLRKIGKEMPDFTKDYIDSNDDVEPLQTLK